MTDQSRKILLALSIKYKGNWNAIYSFVMDKEEISEEEINRLIGSIHSKYVIIGDEEYPEHLKHFNHPPFVLFYYGDISLIKTNEKSLGVVGSRENSSYGELFTRKLVKEVCGSLVIVSGLARGIDSIAASECLLNGGKTVAVLGSGIDYCYPKKNIDLYNKIKEKGLLISEYPNDTVPENGNFPNRNRIIAGLSRNLLVPEARINSGTSITASLAMEMGETVFCVPDRAGTNSLPNYLISYGAKITETAQDILEEYEPYPRTPEFEI